MLFAKVLPFGAISDVDLFTHVARGALGASRASLRVSSETWMMASVLASFVAQVRGVKFYGLQVHVARRVVLVRRPDNPYDNNCLDVREAYRSCWAI